MTRWVAAACGLLALLAVGGCRVHAGLVVLGQPVTVVTPAHEHGPGCGHEYVWYDGHATYYVEGRWVFYAPTVHAWVAYDKPANFFKREEERIVGHGARSSAVPYGARKAPPAPPPDATKAPPAPPPTKAPPPSATKAPPADAAKAPPPDAAKAAPPPSATKAPPADAAKAPPPDAAKAAPPPSATKAPPADAAKAAPPPSAAKAPPA
ncbi:MAG TPA: hypothetical protein VG389_13160, partial [Myxococcota bacterium]|nr:hypothetical protein [Myxococcota bacterium]